MLTIQQNMDIFAKNCPNYQNRERSPETRFVPKGRTTKQKNCMNMCIPESNKIVPRNVF